MKRFLSILISMVIMSAMVLPVGVFAEGEETANPVLTIPVTQDQSVIWNKSDSTVAANPYTNNKGELVADILVANQNSIKRRHALMEFNCSANAEQLTAINAATKIELVLTFNSLQANKTHENQLLLYHIQDAYDDTWKEAEVTWNSAKIDEMLKTANDDILETKTYETISALQDKETLVFDVTDHLKNDKNGIFGFRFHTDVARDIVFYSKESGEAVAPVLKLYVPNNEVTIKALEDTFVYAKEPDKNNGSAENLVGDARPKYKRISFIRFNSFDGLDVVSKKIELKLYVTGTEIKDNTQPVKMKVYGITDDKTTWKENELTYNTATSLITEGTEIATIEVAGRNEYTIDVTDYVRSQSDGAYVFRLQSEANVFVVGSSESDNPPVLYIAEPENEIWFADADGYTNKISNGSLTAKITKTDGADGVLLVALYENVNGSLKLLNVITDNEATVDGDNKVYEQAITVSDSAKQVVKAFFVDSMQNIIPLVAAKELK